MPVICPTAQDLFENLEKTNRRRIQKSPRPISRRGLMLRRWIYAGDLPDASSLSFMPRLQGQFSSWNQHNRAGLSNDHSFLRQNFLIAGEKSPMSSRQYY
jgi:hypothetical protein